MFAMNMNPGWNLANTLDAYGLGRGAGTPEVYETYWGSAPVTQAYIHTIAVAGFRTLRVPVTWFEHMDEEHRIQEPWLNRVQAVVDMALREGMYVILNAHHDAWYTPDPATLDSAVATLQAVWGQIADRFAAYGDHLLFESMNEPRLIGDPTEWTGGTLQARECVNRLNAAFVATVRAAGERNASRYLLLPAYAAGVQADSLAALSLPNDSRLMVSAHLYAPYDFALNEAGTSQWSSAVDEDTREIRDAFDRLTRLFTSQGIPVVLTEFGAVDKHNEAARTAWASYVTDQAFAAHIPCVWWDTSLWLPDDRAWRYPDLLTALTRRGM